MPFFPREDANPTGIRRLGVMVKFRGTDHEIPPLRDGNAAGGHLGSPCGALESAYSPLSSNADRKVSGVEPTFQREVAVAIVRC